MCGFGTDWIKAAAENASSQDEEMQVLDNALIIFAKNPVWGKVKTRLAKTIGDAAAFDAYQQMLAHVRNVAMQVDCHRVVFYSDFVDEGDAWGRPVFSKEVQSGADIGEKMHNALASTLAKGYEKVVLVGCDLLDLQVQHLKQAFRSLEFHDIVIGPADDGGYYLIGMKAPDPSLFFDKTWSHAKVLTNTLADIQKQGKSVQLVAQLSDIDDENDWLAALERRQGRGSKT